MDSYLRIVSTYCCILCLVQVLILLSKSKSKVAAEEPLSCYLLHNCKLLIEIDLQ